MEVIEIFKAYKIEVVRTKIAEPLATFESATQVAEKYGYLEKYDREHVIRLDLDSQNRLVGEETVAIGTADMVALSPREIFRGALLNGAKSIIMLHNHPSGSLQFSKEDVEFYEAIKEAGKIIQIKVLDFLIIGEDGGHRSMV